MSDVAWTWLGIRASGVTAWGLLTAVVIWGILLRSRVVPASALRMVDLHRWLSVLALAFLAVHLVLLTVDPSVTFTWAQILVPGIAPWQPLAVALGTLALWSMVPVTVVVPIRARLGRAGAALFRVTHLLAYAAWPLATAHYVLAGTDALAEWSIGLLIAGTALIVLALIARGLLPAVATRTR